MRGAGSPRGGGRGRGRGYSVSTAAGNIVRIREKPMAVEFDKVSHFVSFYILYARPSWCSGTPFDM